MNENKIDEKEELSKTKEFKENITQDDDMTREINLDDLYDGAINNTMILDPVTKNEVIIENNKRNYTFISIIICVFILLILYYVTTKSPLSNEEAKVEPSTTKVTVVTSKNSSNLVCNYNDKNENYSLTSSLEVNFENDKIVYNKLNLNGLLISELPTEDYNNIITAYEELYTLNSDNLFNKLTFIKEDKSFTFTSELNFEQEYLALVNTDKKYSFYKEYLEEDDIHTIKDAYTNLGYTCLITEGKDN